MINLAFIQFIEVFLTRKQCMNESGLYRIGIQNLTAMFSIQYWSQKDVVNEKYGLLALKQLYQLMRDTSGIPPLTSLTENPSS